MKSLLTLIVSLTLISGIFSQSVGINIDTPEFLLDVRASDTASSAVLNLGNKDNTHFLDIISGGELFPSPTFYWREGDPLRFASSQGIFTEHMRIDVGGKVGIGTSTPSQRLAVNGKIKIGNDLFAPEAGAIRWNQSTQDFEGYDGNEWISFTKSNFGGGWGVAAVNENTSLGLTAPINYAQLGEAVDLSGDFAVVGMPGGGANQEGGALILKRSGNNWTINRYLNIDETNPFDLYGSAVAIDGDYAVVGARTHEETGQNNRGKVYIFHREGEDWNLQDSISASDSEEYDEFGSSVDIHGDWILVGAPKVNVGITNWVGRAYLFHRTDTIWTEEQILNPSDGALLDQFGYEVAIYGDYAIVGAPYANSVDALNGGKVYPYKWNGISWEEETILIPSDTEPECHFGESIDLDDENMVIGAPFAQVEGNSNQGKAYFFSQNNNNQWVESQILIEESTDKKDRFGFRVGINGGYAVITAYLQNFGANDAQGAAYIYKKAGNSWNKHADLKASDGADQDLFGSSVSISGDWIAVGAPKKDAGAISNTGWVYFFEH